MISTLRAVCTVDYFCYLWEIFWVLGSIVRIQFLIFTGRNLYMVLRMAILFQHINLGATYQLIAIDGTHPG